MAMMPLLDDGFRSLPSLPAAFSWFPYTIQTSPNKATSTFDFNAAKPTAGTTYYVSETGSAGADGLTPETPLNTLANAFAKPSCGRIVVVSEILSRPRLGNSAVTLTADLVIESGHPNGTTFYGSDKNQTWTVNGTYPNVYQLTRSNVASVWDETWLDSEGFWRRLTLQSSVLDVNNNAGSYYVDGSNVVYVRTFDSRMPSNSINLMLGSGGAIFTYNGPYKLWVNNIRFAGVRQVRVEATSAVLVPTAYFQNGWSRYNTETWDGIQFLSCDSYCRNFTASKNVLDGIDYTNTVTRANRFYEDSCGGRSNGTTTGANNGTTSHGGAIGIRLNSRASLNDGPNIADVDAGTTTLNVNCVAADTLQPSGNRCNYLYRAGTAWMVNCQSVRPVTADVLVETAATVRYFGSQALSSVGTVTRVTALSDIFL
jgi:hypothetical protein